MTITVRPAGIADLDAVTDLIAASYAQYEAIFPRPMWQVYRADMLDLEHVITAGAVLVAEQDGRVVGSVVFTAGGPSDRPAWPGGTAALRLLAVAPNVRGSGIGRLLMDECIRRAREAGASALGLHTAPFMAAATRMYEGAGFQRAPALDFDAYQRFGVARGDDAPPIDGLAYLLPLDGT